MHAFPLVDAQCGLREIRDKISLDIKDLTTEQMKEYLSKQNTLHPTVWQKEGFGASNEV